MHVVEYRSGFLYCTKVVSSKGLFLLFAFFEYPFIWMFSVFGGFLVDAALFGRDGGILIFIFYVGMVIFMTFKDLRYLQYGHAITNERIVIANKKAEESNIVEIPLSEIESVVAKSEHELEHIKTDGSVVVDVQIDNAFIAKNHIERIIKKYC